MYTQKRCSFITQYSSCLAVFSLSLSFFLPFKKRRPRFCFSFLYIYFERAYNAHWTLFAVLCIHIRLVSRAAVKPKNKRKIHIANKSSNFKEKRKNKAATFLNIFGDSFVEVLKESFIFFCRNCFNFVDFSYL